MENLKYYTFEETLSPDEVKTLVFSANSEIDDDAPFKNCVIVNDGKATIKVFTNQGKHFIPVPAGTIKAIEGEQIESLRIENRSSVLDAEFIYMIDNKYTTKELLKMIAGVN